MLCQQKSTWLRPLRLPRERPAFSFPFPLRFPFHVFSFPPALREMFSNPEAPSESSLQESTHVVMIRYDMIWLSPLGVVLPRLGTRLGTADLRPQGARPRVAPHVGLPDGALGLHGRSDPAVPLGLAGTLPRKRLRQQLVPGDQVKKKEDIFRMIFIRGM